MADGDYERMWDEDERYEIPLNCDYVIRRHDMRRWNRSSRQWELIETAPIAVGWISLERGGAPIDASLEDINLIFGAPGDVDGLLNGEDVTAHLADLVGKGVYDNVRIETEAGKPDYIDSRLVVVVLTATPRRG